MKIVRNSLLIIVAAGLLSLSSEVNNAGETPLPKASINPDEGLSAIPSNKDEDMVIYKKDIIIRSDELKEKKKRYDGEFKTIESPPVKKQETPAIEIADKYLKEGKKYEARNILSEIFINNKMPEKQKEIKTQLDKLNEELIFSPLPSPDVTIYTVKNGDILSVLAKQFNTNYELIMRINGKPTTKLNVGEKLKILTGKTKLLISKSNFTLTLLLDNNYVKQYKIGTGKNDKTPEGKFEVKNKIKEPTWYSPFGGIFPYGHKENILGTRWIGFKDKPNLYGYGIHGTTMPESIGTDSSNGCIRMVNSDVDELYDFVTLDTEIIIQR